MVITCSSSLSSKRKSSERERTSISEGNLIRSRGEMPHHHFDLTREICFRITWEEAVTAAFG